MFTARFMTEYALKVVSNRCTLGDAYRAFGTEYPKFYAIYEKVRQTDELIKASRQLSDASTKIFILSSLGEKVKEMTNMLDVLSVQAKELYEESQVKYQYIGLYRNTYYKDWTLQLEATYVKDDENTENLGISPHTRISIEMWKNDIRLGYVGNYEDKEGMENCINQVLNDIGYTDDLRKQQEQIRKNKGLQVFLYLLQDNIIGR